MSTGDGDCLFNSVSILKYGSRGVGYSHHLHLASIVHAIHHFDHYLDMVCTIYSTVKLEVMDEDVVPCSACSTSKEPVNFLAAAIESCRLIYFISQ